MEKDQYYLIELAKVKIFNDEMPVTMTTPTTFEPIENIGDVVSCDFINIVQDSLIAGIITAIEVIEQPCLCPKCYSTDVEYNGKTIKCITCKSRSLHLKDSIHQNEIKLNVTDINHNIFEFIVERSKVQVLLQESNHEQLCRNDLVEDEDILVFKFIAEIGDNDENATSNTQISTDEDKSSLSSEDEQNDEIPSINVQTDPTLQEIRLLVKRIRRLVSLVCKSSNLHKYVQQQKKEKKLPGD
ncbi:unnamed protein product, partial [Rotaria sp. Silwood2]